MRILVTGADGLLGSNVIRYLLKHRHEVVAFLLEGSTAETIKGLAVEFAFGNLLDKESLCRAIRGCDMVIHAAANTSIWPERSELVRRVNIEGTSNLVEAALEADVKRMVYIGTANSFGFGSKENPGDETRPYCSAKYGLDYMDSKCEAQQLVLKAVKERHLPALILNPTFMLGPYDFKPSAGAMIKAVYQGKVPGYTGGGRNYIAVKDVAHAVVNALTMGRVGECYICGHRNLNYKEAFRLIAQTIGVKTPSIPIPGAVSKAFGALGTWYGRLSGTAPTVSSAIARISADEHYFSAAKAIRELQLPQSDLRIAIRESFEWMRDHGVLDR